MYPNNSSRSAALFDRAMHVMPGGNTRHGVHFAPYPVYQACGKGCLIKDVDGVERIDFVNNWSSLIHGHCNPKIVAAVSKQAGEVMAVGAPTEVEIELAELFCERLPGVEQIRFSNSGTEAVLLALRAARAYTGRQRIAKAEGAYHGKIDAMAISTSPGSDRWGDPKRPAAVPDSQGIPTGVLDDTIVLPFNDVEATRALLEENSASLAAVIVDPLVSRMGFLPATTEYLSMLRDVTAANGIVLIFDEVFSVRLGYHGAQGEFGITPDLTALGKVIGGGLPVGATGGSSEVMSVFDGSSGHSLVEHAGTYNANPMTMSAGLACMQQLTPDAFERLNDLGDRARDGLRDALQVAGIPGQVLGQGSLVSLLFSDKPFRNYRELPIGAREVESIIGLHRYLLNHGVQMIPYGLFILSTAMNEANIDYMIEQALNGMRVIAHGD